MTSDCWFAENVTPTVFKERSGKACNGWERWREDVDLAAAMNLDAYRFSVEWARVEPVEGEFSAAALAHYEAIVDHCVERGLAPVVTFHHFVAPHWFAARGGWLDAEAPERFARFCDRIMAAFGDRIAVAVTMNEPNLPPMLAWAGLPDFVRDLERETLEACTRATGVERYRLTNITLAEEVAPCSRARPRGTARLARRSRRVARIFPSACRSRSWTTSSTARIPPCGTASAPRSTSPGWSSRARTTSSAYRTTSGTTTTRPVP